MKELNNTISHACKGCGACCKNRGDISLSPLDVFNLSKLLGISQEKFINKYCTVEAELDVRIRAIGRGNTCVFLSSPDIKGKTRCQVYDARPMACYLFPLAVSDRKGKGKFIKNAAPYCLKSETAIPYSEFVPERYDKEFDFDNKYLYVVTLYCYYPERYAGEGTLPSEEEMIKFFYCNNSSVEQIEQKIDDFLKEFGNIKFIY